MLIDNYDSFTYNVYQMVGCICPDIQVFRNDKITVEELAVLRPERLILSPGPGFPALAGITIAAIHHFYKEIPVLGICLGHQAIGEAMGGKVVHAAQLVHGKKSMVNLDHQSPLFAGLPERLGVARYHSLIVEEESLPEVLEVTAKTDRGEIMAFQHRAYPLFGVQFHPESILTEQGEQIMQNFLRI